MTWTTRQVSHWNGLRSVAFGNGTFVAVGSGGLVCTSYDGITWAYQYLNIPGSLYGVAYGNGTFVAVGSNGGIITSSDNGLSWTTANSYTYAPYYGLNYDLYSVTYGFNKFVAVGGVVEPSFNLGVVLSSGNGITWTGNNTPNYGLQGLDRTYTLLGITSGNDKFVASGDSHGIITSDQYAYEWTQHIVSNTSTHTIFWNIAYGKNMFVAVGVKSQGDSWVPVIYISSDGESWTEKSTGSTSGMMGVTYGLESFVAVGENGTILQSDSFSNKLIITKSGSGFGTVTSDPSAIDCGTICSASYVWGTQLSLTANHDINSYFT